MPPCHVVNTLDDQHRHQVTANNEGNHTWILTTYTPIIFIRLLSGLSPTYSAAMEAISNERYEGIHVQLKTTGTLHMQ